MRVNASAPEPARCFAIAAPRRRLRPSHADPGWNIGHIGKDNNAAVARMANSRRARPTNGAHHSLRGRALPQTPWDALKLA